MAPHSVISLHVGQAGVQIGSSCWELYCIEHGIDPSGCMNCECKDDSFTTFYNETSSGKYVPRSVFIDLEPSVIDEIRDGPYNRLFLPDQLVSGKEDAANNYGRGYRTVGSKIIDKVMDHIRRVTERSPGLVGFMIYHSAGGGTGSGFTSLLLKNLSEEYKKKTKLQFVIYPSPRLSTAVIEPYNALLMTHTTMDHSDCTFIVDNEAIYGICLKKLGMERPTYTNLNRMLGQVASSVTATIRFEGAANVDLVSLQTNLVPFPKIHFPILTHAPFTRDISAELYSITDITRECFSKDNQMVICDPTEGSYMACCMLYRGPISPKEVKDAINDIKKEKRMKLVNWSPTGFKIGISYRSPSNVPNSDMVAGKNALTMLANNTRITEAWNNLKHKFDLMFSKRTFLHWFYGENMEESDFTDARNAISDLQDEYETISKDSVKDMASLDDSLIYSFL